MYWEREAYHEKNILKPYAFTELMLYAYALSENRGRPLSENRGRLVRGCIPLVEQALFYIDSVPLARRILEEFCFEPLSLGCSLRIEIRTHALNMETRLTPVEVVVLEHMVEHAHDSEWNELLEKHRGGK